MAGCTSGRNNTITEALPTEVVIPKPDVSYTLINMEKGSSTKCILDIRLSGRIPEEKIKRIAEYIVENEGKGCSPLFIFYFLPDEKPGIDMAWAFSHYNPQLEIKINGLDLETKATLEAKLTKADENVIGSWLDTGVLSHTIVIKIVKDTYQMSTVYGDGSGETKTLGVEVVNGEERLYENPGNYYGDYMVIQKNGNLAFYDNKGLIYELKPK